MAVLCVLRINATYLQDRPNETILQGGSMKSRLATILAALLLGSAGLAYSQGVASDVDKAAKDTGKETKKVAKKTGKGTEKAAEKTEDTTEAAAKKTGHATKKGAKDVGHGVKKSA